MWQHWTWVMKVMGDNNIGENCEERGSFLLQSCKVISAHFRFFKMCIRIGRDDINFIQSWEIYASSGQQMFPNALVGSGKKDICSYIKFI